MKSNITINQFSKLFFGISFLLFTGLYSCNNTKTEEEKMETMEAPADTTMNMSTDTIKTDTAGKGGQPLPPGR